MQIVLYPKKAGMREEISPCLQYAGMREEISPCLQYAGMCEEISPYP